MFPGPIALAWIGCLTGLTWTQESQSNMSTPPSQSLTSNQEFFHLWKMDEAHTTVSFDDTTYALLGKTTRCPRDKQNLSQTALHPNNGQCAVSACTLLTQEVHLQAQMWTPGQIEPRKILRKRRTDRTHLWKKTQASHSTHAHDVTRHCSQDCTCRRARCQRRCVGPHSQGGRMERRGWGYRHHRYVRHAHTHRNAWWQQRCFWTSHHDVTDLVAAVTHGRTAVKNWCSSSRAFHWTTWNEECVSSAPSHSHIETSHLLLFALDSTG